MVYDALQSVTTMTEAQCKLKFSKNGVSFYEAGTYACGPVPDNNEGSYLTMLSLGGLKFGIINIVCNFSTVFVDQSYWQSAIAAKPASAHKGYLLGGFVGLQFLSRLPLRSVSARWHYSFPSHLLKLDLVLCHQLLQLTCSAKLAPS